MHQLSAQAAAAFLNDNANARLLDVREDWEWQRVHLPGSVHMPMSKLTITWQSLDPQYCWLVLCHHGVRSAQVAAWLSQQGLPDVINVAGGIEAWSLQVDASLPRY